MTGFTNNHKTSSLEDFMYYWGVGGSAPDVMDTAFKTDRHSFLLVHEI
jgi:hypothetical protein